MSAFFFQERTRKKNRTQKLWTIKHENLHRCALCVPRGRSRRSRAIRTHNALKNAQMVDVGIGVEKKDVDTLCFLLKVLEEKEEI